MNVEIERKFLVKPGAWSAGPDGCRMTQGYLSLDPDRTVRVRIAGDLAFMTVKGRTVGMTRTEIEFPISLEHAEALMALCLRPWIDKTRHRVMHDGMLWEIDVFHGENEGLTVAEIELPSEDHGFSLPVWLGEEVTSDPRFSNASLSSCPFGTW